MYTVENNVVMKYSAAAHTYRRMSSISTERMVNKGFPTFGTRQDGVHVSTLRNYNIPEFILKRVATDCDSDLLEKGRMDDRLQSMNEDALKMLYRIFVDCEEDENGVFSHYRFFAYVSSAFHKCELLMNDTVPGESGKNHLFPVTVKSKGVYVAVAQNKASGNPVSKRDVVHFYETVADIKRGEHGTMISEAIYGSSVGVKTDAAKELGALGEKYPKDDENHIDFRVVNFENNIYVQIPV